MLPALKPLDGPTLAAEIEQALAAADEASAIHALGRNPLAVFGWLHGGYVLPAYVGTSPAPLHRLAALVILFRRWCEETTTTGGDDAGRIARACLERQSEALAAAVRRLHDLDEDHRREARRAHREMTQAAMLRDMGQERPCHAAFAAALDAWDHVGEPFFAGQVSADWGAVLEQTGELDAALDQLTRAVGLADRQGDLARLGRRRLHCGKLALMSGQTDVALAQYREAAGVFRLTREAAGCVTALVAEGEVLRLAEDAEGATRAFGAAVVVASSSGDAELVAFAEGAAAGPPA